MKKILIGVMLLITSFAQASYYTSCVNDLIEYDNDYKYVSSFCSKQARQGQTGYVRECIARVVNVSEVNYGMREIFSSCAYKATRGESKKFASCVENISRYDLIPLSHCL